MINVVELSIKLSIKACPDIYEKISPNDKAGGVRA
jgi:hypothetical protein